MMIWQKISAISAFIFLFSLITPALANDEPVPFVCTGEAYTVRDTPGKFFRINQNVTPFTFELIGDEPPHDVLEGPFGINGELIKIQVNNIGYRAKDNFIYGVALANPTVFNFNYGLVKIDSLGHVFKVDTDPNINLLPLRFLAGDIDPNSDIMYLNTYATSTPMYITDFNEATPKVSVMTLVTSLIGEGNELKDNTVFVADWAVNPVNGKLYGADGLCNPNAQIYELDPIFDPMPPAVGPIGIGVVTNLGHPTVGPMGVDLPCSNGGDAQYYGGAWFNAQGRLFVYRNSDHIYEIDLSSGTPEVVSHQAGGAGPSTFNDATACAAGVPIVDKFYTYTNNNWAPRCATYADGICVEYRLANVNLDDDIFADPLPQNDDDQYVLQGKALSNKTAVTPGQYFAVSNVQIPKEQNVWIQEDFSDPSCLQIGTVNPMSVPGGVQVVLITADGDVHDISGLLANGVGGSIDYDFDAGNVLVHAENLPADSVLRVMVKFQPSDALGIIGLMCTNHENALDEEMNVITSDTATLVIEAK